MARIPVTTRIFIQKFFSSQHGIIKDHTLINFWAKFQPKFQATIILKVFWSLNEIYSIQLYLEKLLVCHFKYVVVLVLRKFVEASLLNLDLKKIPTTCLFWTTRLLILGKLSTQHAYSGPHCYTQYGPIKNVGIFPGLGVLYFCPDFQGWRS